MLLATLLVAGVLTAAFMFTTDEMRVSAGDARVDEALRHAETHLERVLATHRAAFFRGIGSDTTLAPRTVREDGRAIAEVRATVHRLDERVYLVTSSARLLGASRRSATQSRVARVVRTLHLELPTESAMTVLGSLVVGGSAEIHGSDAGAPDCLPGEDRPGVIAPAESSVSFKGNNASVQGSPPVAADPTLSAPTLLDYGDVDFADLAAIADIRLPPSTDLNGMRPAVNADGECDLLDSANWGDPSGTGPCADYFPIIHAAGDLHVRTGTGQGILLVEGNLRVTGNFEFYGLVVVRGGLQTSGTGNHLQGTTLVLKGSDLDELEGDFSQTTGNSLVQFSSCRVAAAGARLLTAPVASRSWIDLGAVTPPPPAP